MNANSTVLCWLAVPVAAAAGYLGSHRYHDAREGHVEGVFLQTKPPSSVPTPASIPGLVTTWTSRLARCTAADLPSFYAEIQLTPDMEDIRRLTMLLCARWVELDAPSGLAFFSALGDEGQKSAGRTMLLTEWALQDPLAAHGMITKQPPLEAEADLINIGYALLNGDPDKFWIWFQHGRKPLPWSWGGNDAWQRLASAHFDEISVIAGELMEAEVKSGGGSTFTSKLEGLYSVLAGTMAEKDPDKAMEWAKQLPESVRNQALTGALEVLVRKSPEKIADYPALLKRKQTGGSSYIGSGAEALIEKAVSALLQRDTLQTLDWLRKNYEKLGDYPYGVCRQFGVGLAADMRAGKMTPEQAFAAVSAKGEYDGAIRSEILANMWQGLPAEQLATTAKWLTTLESKDAAKLAIQGIFPEWIKQDQSGALAFAATLPDREPAANMFERVAQDSMSGLVSTQGERMANALKLIPPEYRAEILDNQIRMNYEGSTMDYRGSFNGSATAAALENLPPGPSTEMAYTRVASTWAAGEPEASLAWATGQPDNTLRKTATGAAVEAWAKEDAWGASQWIDAQPAGETRDTASHHLALSLSKQEPASAWTWAGSIGDPATRLDAQAAVLQEWRNTSAQEATAAVQGLAQTLPPSDYQRLVDALVPKSKTK